MRLVIAEDSLIFREGLTKVLEDRGHQVLATAAHADQVLAMVARHHPDVLLMDIRMPPTHTDEGLRLAVTVHTRHPTVGVLVLSQYEAASYAANLLDGGAKRTGYLLKDTVLDATILEEALHRVHSGGTVIDPALVSQLMNVRRQDDPLDLLTARERDVLALMAQGLSDRGIADRLHVSVTTVGTHTQHLFRKLALTEDPVGNRRVTAVLRYLREPGQVTGPG
jgi:DNA-binding NarL/FixJ family response regulator